MDFLQNLGTNLYNFIFRSRVEKEEIKKIESTNKKLRFRNMSIASENWAQGLYPEDWTTPFIQGAMWFKKNDLPTREEMRNVMEPLVRKYYRLRSKIFQLSTGKLYFQELKPEDVDWDEQIIEREVSSEQEIRDIMQENLNTKLSRTKPVWEIRIFKNVGPRGSGRSCVLLAFDHSIGDGLSLLKLTMGMVQDAEGKPMEFKMPERPRGKGKGLFAKIKKYAWHAYRLIRAHIQTLVMASQNDSPTRFKIPRYPESTKASVDRLVFNLHSLTIQGLSKVRAAILEKTGKKATINDTIFGLIAGAMRRMMAVTNDAEFIRTNNGRDLKMRAWSPFSFPHPDDLAEDDQLRNLWSMVCAPLPCNISSSSIDRILVGKTYMDDLKTGHAALAASQVQRLVCSTLGYNVQGVLSLRTASSQSLMWTNVPGFKDKVTVAGHVVDDTNFILSTPIPYITVGSYNMHINLTACIAPELLEQGLSSPQEGAKLFAKCWEDEVEQLCNETNVDSSLVFYNHVNNE